MKNIGDNLKIIIGLPAFNEEKNIASLIIKLKEISKDIIVCNDGSSDLTGKIAEELNVEVINHTKNIGYGGAIRSIFLKSKEMNADILVTFDADGQHKIEDIKNVLNPIIKNQCDVSIGSRFLKKDSEVPDYRKLGIKVITSITNASIKKKLTDAQSGFRAYNKKALQEINPTDLGMGISTEILIKASKKDLRISEVPINILYKGDTSTHNPVSHGASVLLSTIKYTSIEHPLKFYGISSIIFLSIGLAFVLWSIHAFAIDGKIITNITLIGIGSTIVGVVLVITAILLYSLISVVREQNN
jgi:glycosyltransferase involved in cell wall biosynthesis